MCEQLGQEPDPDKMPLEASDFPREIQAAFLVFNSLSDKWESMSGMYLGKEYLEFPMTLSIYNLDYNQENLFFWCKMIDSKYIEHRTEEAEKKRKAEEKKAKRAARGDKKFTHNVTDDGQ